MLWLCLHLPQWPAEAQGLRDPLDAVTDSHGARRWLVSGPLAGQPLAEALLREPELRAHPRRPSAEKSALRALAHGLYRYGSPVSTGIEDPGEPGRIPRVLAWVEIGASLRLFGGIDALCAELSADLAELQQTVRLGVAPTRAAAALLAVAGDDAPVMHVAELEPRLAGLSVQWLPWPLAVLDALQGMGLRRLGDLFALPRAGFARRFGPERLQWLDRLRGLTADPVSGIRPPARFRRRFELPGEVETLEALLFPLRRMSLELQAWLRARDTGICSLELHCEHANRRCSTFGLRFVSAHRDGQRILDALRERLQREAMLSPVRALQLRSIELGAVPTGQGELFGADSDTRLQWAATVERLLARLGESALWTPAVVADPRPERAQIRDGARDGTCKEHREPSRAAGRSVVEADVRRPLWLLPTPVPLNAIPRGLGEPERIESGWWDGADARRDYHCIDWQNARAWVYRDHASQCWYLHGWFA